MVYAATALECGTFNRLDRVGDLNIGQIATIHKHVVGDSRCPFRNHKARETRHAGKDILAKSLDRFGDDGILTTLNHNVGSRLNHGITILAGVIDRIILINGDAFQAWALREGCNSNVSHRTRNIKML